MNIEDVRRFPESSSVEEVKRKIIDLIRKLSLDEGHVLPKRQLVSLSMKLDPKQKDALPEALEALKEDGILADDPNGYALTREGKDRIY